MDINKMIALEWLKQQDLSSKKPAEAADLYKKALKEIKANDKKNKKPEHHIGFN
ncbi:hypothetical protein WR164_02910 [Philodulcilactobacillus myokoensis]|uniref:Uncharacterized protein n=1 Tax=Philodulcilactobacillus myokoensis TaxID=2929573 RepID=A0A9W6ESA4_9LACO|nr:hypothetical protein [Philodulcilactobacillus myokoensis]GLB46312.1 hypothetical protein WR164_02910 [Philodulcilactobacillus myokoensis]